MGYLGSQKKGFYEGFVDRLSAQGLVFGEGLGLNPKPSLKAETINPRMTNTTRKLFSESL